MICDTIIICRGAEKKTCETDVFGTVVVPKTVLTDAYNGGLENYSKKHNEYPCCNTDIAPSPRSCAVSRAGTSYAKNRKKLSRSDPSTGGAPAIYSLVMHRQVPPRAF